MVVTCMHKIVVYSKDGCHLCERALAKLEDLSKDHEFQLTTFEISNERKIFEKYVLSIPVVELDGRVVFQASDITAPGDIEIELEKVVQALDVRTL